MRIYSGRIASLVLLLEGACAVAQESPRLEHYCRELAADGISLAEMPGSETRGVRVDLVLQTIRLCPQEFISAASLFPTSDSPLSAIRDMVGAADPSAIAVSRDAVTRIRTADDDPNSTTVRKQLLELLRQPQSASVRDVVEVERRDSEDLANMAARQRVRTGERQSILVQGIFIMLVANRVALNAAFESVPSSQDWLRRFPPGIGMVGGGKIGEDVREFERSVIRRAQAYDGPIDKWYRGFKIEQ